MPDDDPLSDDAPLQRAETPAMKRGTLRNRHHLDVGMAINITEQQHAEENQRDREQRLRERDESVRRLFDAIPQIVWTNDVDGSASYFNRHWYEYTGLNYEQSAGPGWEAGIHPDDAPVSKNGGTARSRLAKCLNANTGCVTQPENIDGSSGGMYRCAITIALSGGWDPRRIFTI